MNSKILIIIILWASIITCQKEDHKRFGDLKGIILNEFDQPIEGASVEIESNYSWSKADGKYSFEKLPAKEYSVTVSKKSFLTKIQKINILENEIAELNFVMAAGDTYLNIPDSTVKINADKVSLFIRINSNANWRIINTSGWLECTQTTGQGDGNVTINCSENREFSNRTDTIEFISGSIKKPLVIYQSAPIRVIKYASIIGNGEFGIEDSLYILFNKPVRIQNDFSSCSSSMSYKQTDKNCGVMISIPCAELGGSYPFSISVKDDEGNSLITTINFQFYRSKTDLKSIMTDYLFINDEKEILISTVVPSRLIRYSIAQDSVLKVYDLSGYISPSKISFNPFNAKIYILGSKPDATLGEIGINRPEIYSFDLKTGQIVKALTIQPDEKDHPLYPANIPYDIGFTRSGFGVVLLKSNISSELRWKLIDSSSHDSIYSYPYYDEIISEYTDFNDIQLNYDKTKLFLTQAYGSCDYGIFDGNTQKISVLQPRSVTRSVFISPSKKSDKFYAGQIYDQFIIDLQGNLSRITDLDNRHQGSADFCYRENGDNFIYFCEKVSFVDEDNRFFVLDYNKGSIVLWCDLIEDLTKFRTSSNGKYAIAYKINLDVSSSIFVFNTDSFHRLYK
jgi:hypothetical protein